MGEFKEERILTNKELQDKLESLEKFIARVAAKASRIDEDLDIIVEQNNLRYES